MRSILKRSIAGTLAGFVSVAAVGCAPAGEESLDSLPWSNVSVPQIDVDICELADTPGSTLTDAEELEFRDQIVHKCLADFRRIASEPLLIQAVVQANDGGWQSQHQIDQTDLRWRQTKGATDPLVQKYLMNPCADFLRREQQKRPEYLELFVMDNKGCIVAESNKTSDYWQGDEPKWIDCYNGGEGQVFVGDVEYDQSTRSYVVQISLPIHDERNATIGAITVSITSGSHD